MGASYGNVTWGQDIGRGAGAGAPRTGVRASDMAVTLSGRPGLALPYPPAPLPAPKPPPPPPPLAGDPGLRGVAAPREAVIDEFHAPACWWWWG